MSLAKKLLDAQRRVSTLPLDGKGPQYRYTSAEALLEAARDSLHESGLVLCPVSVSIVIQSIDGSDEVTDTRSGEVKSTPRSLIVLVSASYLLTDVDSGESVPLVAGSAHGIPIDRRGVGAAETAIASARTYALRDLLRDLLLAPKSKDAEDVRPSGRNGGATFASAVDKVLDSPAVAAPAITAAPAMLASAIRPAPASKPPVRVTSIAADDPAPDEPKTAPVSEPIEQLLAAAGWSPDYAVEMLLAPDDAVAPASAVLDIHKAINDAAGVEASRAGWARLNRDPRLVCAGKESINWAELRSLALCRGGK